MKSLESECSKDLSLLPKWGVSNKYSLYNKKSHFLLSTGRLHVNGSFSLVVIGNVLERKSRTKRLGFRINESFTWEDHVSYICRHINYSLFLLQQCQGFIRTKSTLAFYYQFIYYDRINGIRLYANLTSSHCTNKFLLLQKRAFRLIANVQDIPRHPTSAGWFIISICICCVSTARVVKYLSGIVCYVILHRLSLT